MNLASRIPHGQSSEPERRSVSSRVRVCIAWVVLLCWCASTGAAEPSIDTITFERGCFGCSDESVLVLRRSGDASLVTPANARMGTEARTLQGHVDAASFDRLARLAASEGLFEMKDSYQDPALRDGAWTTTAIRRGDEEKRIFVGNDAGPPGLKRFNSALGEVRQGIAFRP